MVDRAAFDASLASARKVLERAQQRAAVASEEVSRVDAAVRRVRVYIEECDRRRRADHPDDGNR